MRTVLPSNVIRQKSPSCRKTEPSSGALGDAAAGTAGSPARTGGASPVVAWRNAEPNTAAVTRLAARTRRVSSAYARPAASAPTPDATQDVADVHPSPAIVTAAATTAGVHRGRPCQWTSYTHASSPRARHWVSTTTAGGRAQAVGRCISRPCRKRQVKRPPESAPVKRIVAEPRPCAAHVIRLPPPGSHPAGARER